MTDKVTLELLRHGPSHNQLLSPLTPYLALCGNHDAQSFQLPLEHIEFNELVEKLDYREGDPAAVHSAIERLGAHIQRILGSIPSLATELSSAQHGDIVHLRLVLSASELAALPFELAQTPAGYPGEGQSLLLSNDNPVVLTREARRVVPPPMKWPTRPKILLVAASPGDGLPVPLDAHVLALRRALDPFIGWREEPKARIEEIKRHVTILPRATLAQIEEACAEENFTHVHVLCHGREDKATRGRETRHRLALHAGRDGREIELVNGARFEAALRPGKKRGEGPAVVTLASCDSGNEGSVIVPGGSVAHELHEAGIPFVVASQFPFTFKGSAIFVDRLYAGLLGGTDPRRVVLDVRRALFAECGDTHDWASLIVYASLPPDIERQLSVSRVARARQALDVALKRCQSKSYDDRDRDQLEKRLDHAFERMERMAREQPEDACALLGVQASVALRWADKCRAKEMPMPGQGEDKRGITHLSKLQALKLAREKYRAIFADYPTEIWALVQEVALGFCLEHKLDADGWITASRLAHIALERAKAHPADREALGAAHDDLAQLALLSPFLPEHHGSRRAIAQAIGQARAHVDAILKSLGTGSFQAFSTIRQIGRMASWMPESAHGQEAMDKIKILAESFRGSDVGVPSAWLER